MGLLVLIGFILIAIAVALTYFIYWLLKKMGYPRAAKFLSTIAVVLILVIAMLAIFEDQLFSNGNARELLGKQGIELKEQFRILENKSMSATGDYYHTFTLQISQQDKERIIDEIKKSQNFNKGKQTQDYFHNRNDYYKGPRRIKNYETELQFVRELFEPHGEGYAPTWHKIEIDKKENKLIFEDIDE